MPTKRAWSILIIAIIFYLLANQTQVGWVYIFANILVGFWLMAWLYGLRLLRSASVTRTVQRINSSTDLDDGVAEESLIKDGLLTFHEDDLITILLAFSTRAMRPIFLLQGQEACPFAPPDDQLQDLFIPALFRRKPVRLRYDTICDQRGIYTVTDLPLQTEGPFGLFRHKRVVSAPTQIMIYPAYHRLQRLRLFEKRAIAEYQTLRTGASQQIMGIRDYRSGDPLRTVHWRSTARLGKLAVKEFTKDEDQTMSVVLDLSSTSNVGRGKYSTFETAIRIAASLSHYAHRQKMAFYVRGAGQNWTPPIHALGWRTSLTYLAKVQNDGQVPFAEVMANLPETSLNIVLISRSDPTIEAILRRLQQRGIPLLPLFIQLDETASPASPTLLSAITVTPYNWAQQLSQL